MMPASSSRSIAWVLAGSLGFFSVLLGLGWLFSSSTPEALPLDTEALKLTTPARYSPPSLAFAPTQTGLLASSSPPPPGIQAPELYPYTEKLYQFLEQKLLEAPPLGQNYSLTPPLTPEASLSMIYLPGGKVTLGSPPQEKGRQEEEPPPQEVELSPFWISSIEIPWEVYQSFMDNGRPRNKEGRPQELQETDELWQAVSQPTAPYTAMNLGMGNGYQKGFPAIAMSHYAASKFCEWLSAQTGLYYRLPTAAEWEYACRAGTPEPTENLDSYAWFYDNAQDQYQKTAQKKPNAFGLYDMLGNVAEWVLGGPLSPSPKGIIPKDPYDISPKAPLIVKGGSWDDDPEKLRASAFEKSSPSWNSRDPQNPKSIWYLTEGGRIGFRIVHPAQLPSLDQVHEIWNYSKIKF